MSVRLWCIECPGMRQRSSAPRASRLTRLGQLNLIFQSLTLDSCLRSVGLLVELGYELQGFAHGARAVGPRLSAG